MHEAEGQARTPRTCCLLTPSAAAEKEGSVAAAGGSGGDRDREGGGAALESAALWPQRPLGAHALRSAGGGGYSAGMAEGAAAARQGDGAVQLMRRGYVKAVERCHELQRHVALLADQDGRLRPQLVDALERLAGVQQLNHELEAEIARMRSGGAQDAAAAPWGFASREIDLNRGAAELWRVGEAGAGGFRGGGGGRVGGISGSGSGGASGEEASASVLVECCALRAGLASTHAQLSSLTKQLASKEAAHQSDQAALVDAQRAACDSVRALQAEGEWVRALDEMRLQDLATIQQLEARLAQWNTFHAPSG